MSATRLPDAPPRYDVGNEAQTRRTIEVFMQEVLQRLAELEKRVAALGG